MASLIFLKDRILENYRKWADLCKRNGAGLNVATKFCLSDSAVVHLLKNDGQCPCSTISDSNAENFAKLNAGDAKTLTKCLIKTRISDIEKIPDIIEDFRPNRLFVSDERMLGAVAKLPEEMRPEVVLIAETGDMKDGFLAERIPKVAEKWRFLPIVGVSANFACLSGILPSSGDVRKLAEIADKVRKARKLESPFLSVGGTVVHPLLSDGGLSGLVQEIRAGEGIFFGHDSSGGMALEGFSQDTIVISGEVLEVSEKDFSIQEGRAAGFTATGNAGIGASGGIRRGRRRRAVLDFGVLVARSEDLRAVDSKVRIDGQTFDFTVADIGDLEAVAGGEIRFFANYSAASFALMNRFVARRVAGPQEDFDGR